MHILQFSTSLGVYFINSVLCWREQQIYFIFNLYNKWTTTNSFSDSLVFCGDSPDMIPKVHKFIFFLAFVCLSIQHARSMFHMTVIYFAVTVSTATISFSSTAGSFFSPLSPRHFLGSALFMGTHHHQVGFDSIQFYLYSVCGHQECL